MEPQRAPPADRPDPDRFELQEQRRRTASSSATDTALKQEKITSKPLKSTAVTCVPSGK
jgi:hypothetical protein